MTVPVAPTAPRRPTWREALVVALAIAGGLWLGLRQAGDVDGEAATAATMRSGPGAGVAALTVRTLDGRVTPLARLGEPAIVMVVSRTCGVCKEALRDFGQQAAGRALPHLWLVTLEGAAEGTPMLATAGVRGAVLAGPVTPAAEAYFIFQIQGTPTFLALDAAGRVQRVLPGYPGRAAMADWLAVMSGARTSL